MTLSLFQFQLLALIWHTLQAELLKIVAGLITFVTTRLLSTQFIWQQLLLRGLELRSHRTRLSCTDRCREESSKEQEGHISPLWE